MYSHKKKVMAEPRVVPGMIGTAFTEDDVENKAVPVWEQVVSESPICPSYCNLR